MDAAVQVEGASKKFSKTLRGTMLYSVLDVGAELLGRKASPRLRSSEFWALQDARFSVAPGECVALLGPNGAGKSTMLKMLNGILLPDKGRIALRGRVGALIEVGAGFHPMLTGRENIFVNGTIHGLTTAEIRARLDSIVAFAELEAFLDTPVKFYSSGMYVRLGFAVAAHVEPEVLLIDEVLAVGDVGFRMKCFKHLLGLIEKGTAMVLVSHAVNQLSRVTNRAIVFSKSRQVFDGDLAEGIGVYQHELHVEEETEAGHTRQDTAIESVRVLDNDGEERRAFQTGDDVCVDITLRTVKPIEGARLIVALGTPALGNMGTLATPYRDFAFTVEPPRTTVRLRLKDLPLLVGGYHLNVSLFGPGIEDFHDRLTPGATFKITGPPTNAFGFGLCDYVAFDHEWTLRS